MLYFVSVTLSHDESMSLPQERHRYSSDCVTGCPPLQEWEGIPLSYLLQMVQPTGEELRLRFISTTGYEAVMLPQKLGWPQRSPMASQRAGRVASIFVGAVILGEISTA